MSNAVKLKEYMRDNFDFSSLKKSGVFPKEIKYNDYEAQAKIVCKIFGLESIYDYSNIGRGIPCHISYVHSTPFTRFVEFINGPLLTVVDGGAKIIPFKKSNNDKA